VTGHGLLLISGVVGLAGNLLFFLLVVWLQVQVVPALVSGWFTLFPLYVCLGLSVAEMPLMIVGLRRLAADPKQTSSRLLALTNAFYVFFASVYAGMFVLLTGAIAVGAGLSALGGVRLISSLLFVRPEVEMT
jgi:hypothetical protein